MKALVTGASGFIGRNLMEELKAQGHEVVGIDTTPSNGVVVRDIRSDLSDLFRDVEIVFHEAAITAPPQFEEIPEDGLQINMIGTFNLLKSAADFGVRRAIIASSSATYGTINSPVFESQIAGQMENLYPLTKLFNEHLATYFTIRNELEVVSLRYFNTYGVGENSKGQYSSVISKFLESVKLKESPIIFGDGTQSRDMIYVKDVVRANLLAIKNGKPGEAYNVGTGTSTSFNEVWRIIVEETDTKLKPIFQPNPFKSYQFYTCANTEKAESELKFRSKYTLRDGVKEMLN